MASNKVTPTGARRTGDDYQDIVALESLLQMLETPNLYDYIQVEADDFGYLDDIVTAKADGFVEATQVKFSAHPDEEDDAYSWEKLLEPRVGKKNRKLPSLLEKWGKSIIELHEKGVKIEARLVTNRQAVPELSMLIDTRSDCIDATQIPQEIRLQLYEQLGGEEKTKIVLSTLKFKFNYLPLSVLDGRLFQKFEALGGTHEGWLSLKDSLRKWVREKESPNGDGRIKYLDVRRAALWGHLNTFPEDFRIPEDYILPSRSMNEEVKSRLAQKGGTCTVIYGSPGVGKSTYLSNLCQELKKKDIAVIRHHYFLSTDDKTPERTNHKRILESLMGELETVAPKALAQVVCKNPKFQDFSKWINLCGDYYQRQEHPLVIIIDGLDHVWRDCKKIDELSQLFDYLLPCHPGISLIVGTQPVIDAQIPEKLLVAVPRSEWIEIPLLERLAVKKWVEKNRGKIDGPSFSNTRFAEQFLSEVSSAMYEVSRGHPLILYYALNNITKTGATVTPNLIRQQNIISGSNDINTYYGTLWRSLDDYGQFVLCLIALSNFEWTEEQITRCCNHVSINPVEAGKGWNNIRHLLRYTLLGWVPFHSSSTVFITQQESFQSKKTQLYMALKKWFITDAPNYWQWAYQWEFERADGNSGPLLDGTTRQWIIDSIAEGYPLSQIERLLSLSAKASLEKGDFYLFAHKSLLYEYSSEELANQRLTHLSDAVYSIPLRVTKDKELSLVLASRKNELTYLQLSRLAETLHINGIADDKILQDILDEIRNRESLNSPLISANDSAFLTAYINIKTLKQSLSVPEIIEDIKRNREKNYIHLIIETYASCLHLNTRGKLLKKIAESSDLSNTEKYHFLRHGFLFALEKGEDWDSIARENASSVFSAVYSEIRRLGLSHPNLTPLLPFDSLAKSISFSTRQSYKTWYINCFYSILAYQSSNQGATVAAWLRSANRNNDITSQMIERFISISDKMFSESGDNKFTIDSFYHKFDDLIIEDSQDSLEKDYIVLTIKEVLADISQYCLCLSRGDDCIPASEIQNASLSQFFNCDIWISAYIKSQKKRLSSDAISWVKGNLDIEKLSPSEKSDLGITRATTLAELSLLHDSHNNADVFFRQSIELSLSYGERKDLLFDDLLNSIQYFPDSAREKVHAQLKTLMSAIAHVDEYTDGSETYHLPSFLSEQLIDADHNYIFSIYQSLYDCEEYEKSETVFKNIIKSLNLTTQMETAIAETCLSKDTIALLIQKEHNGCSNLHPTIVSTYELLGHNPFDNTDTIKSSEASVLNKTQSTLMGSQEEMSLEEYPPERLKQYKCDCIAKSHYFPEDALQAWVEYWKPRKEKNKIRSALIELYKTDPYRDCAKFIYELTTELEDRASAWPWLVAAFTNSHGWNRYYSAEARILEMWGEVTKYYPEKWDRFIYETMEKGCAPLLYKIGIHSRLSRLIMFLCQMGKVDVAISLFHGATVGINELVSPFKIPLIKQLNVNRSLQVCLKELLFTRLTWPSGMVRERTCSALSRMLSTPEVSSEISVDILTWISMQNLESFAVLGVLPFIKAKQECPSVTIPSRSEFNRHCKAPSVLFTQLLDYLFCEESVVLDYSGYYSSLPSTKPVWGRVFKNWHAKQLPPWYDETANDIQDETLLPFRNRWESEFSFLCSSYYPNVNTDSCYYWGKKDGEHFMAFDTFLSEILRSAFIRALAWVFSQNKDSNAMVYSIKTLPIDVQVWITQPTFKPIWWPVLNMPKKDAIDTIPTQVLDKIKSFWELHKNADWQIAEASGIIAEGDSTYELKINGICQKSFGNQTPTPQKLFEGTEGMIPHYYTNSVSIGLTGTIPLKKTTVPIIRVNDWKAMPLAGKLEFYTTPRWLWWRFLRGIYAPNSVLAANQIYSITCTPKHIEYYDESGVFAKWYDWTLGLEEKQTSNLPPKTGQILYIKKEKLSEYTRRERCTYMLCLEIKRFDKETQYPYEYKTESCFFSLGENPLIM